MCRIYVILTGALGRRWCNEPHFTDEVTFPSHMGGISPAPGNHFQLGTLAPTCLPVVRMFPPQPAVSSGVTCRWMKSEVMLPPCLKKKKKRTTLVPHLLARFQQLVPIGSLLLRCLRGDI